MRLIALSAPDIELLFAIDAVDRDVLVELLAAKLEDGTHYNRRAYVFHMLRVLAPNHEALRDR